MAMFSNLPLISDRILRSGFEHEMRIGTIGPALPTELRTPNTGRGAGAFVELVPVDFQRGLLPSIGLGVPTNESTRTRIVCLVLTLQVQVQLQPSD